MQPGGLLFSGFDTGIGITEPEFKMNWPQNDRWLNFDVGWLKGTVICNNSLCQLTAGGFQLA